MTLPPRLTIAAGLTLIFLLSALGAFFFRRSLPAAPINPLAAYLAPAGQSPLGGATPTPTPDPLRPRNFLLIGYAGANHDGGTLADTLIVAHLNPKTAALSLISIPRDLWVTLPISEAGYPAKINHSYAIGLEDEDYPDKPPQFQGPQGGLNLARAVVSQVTALDLEAAASINFDGFKAIINRLGGVTINVPYGFSDPWYPIKGREQDACGFTPEDVATLSASLKGDELEHQFTCRYETLEFAAGPHKLDADTALKFVRSRHALNGGGDFGRGLRQQALLKGIKAALLSPANLIKLPSILVDLSRYIDTDIPPALLTEILQLPLNFDNLEIHTITLDQPDLLQATVSRDGQYILVPAQGEGFSSIHAFLNQELSATASPKLKKN